MQAFSKTWTLGTGKSVKWPAGVGAKGNSGVAGLIKNREGAIGYVNQSYIKGKVVAAALQNKSGEFLKPSVAAGAKALNGISLDKDLAGRTPTPPPRVLIPSPPSPGFWRTKPVTVTKPRWCRTLSITC